MPLEINLPLVKADEYAKTFGARTADPSSLPSGMLAGPRYNLDRQNIFVKRNPAMNEVPLFYGDFETEIASLAAVQAMPDRQREAYGIRLIAKRFIDYNTNGSYFQTGDMQKANPGLHQQTMETRILRLQTAVQTINRYGDTYLRDAYSVVRNRVNQIARQHSHHPHLEPMTVHITRPGRMEYMEDCTVNFLSLASQERVREAFELFEKEHAPTSPEPALHFTTVLPGTVISRTARSNAGPIGRLVQQGYYDVSHFKHSDLVVIADDHTQAGSTLLSLGSALMAQGAHVLACVTPTLHPHARHLKMRPHTRQALEEALQSWDPGSQVLITLGEMGMNLDTMTDPEALILLAYATDPNNSAEVEKFHNVERSLRMHNDVLVEVSEGESDSLKPVLEKKYTPEEVLANIQEQRSDSRSITEPLPTTDIHVLDWDDFLRREKTLNYKLLHNAVAQLANMPAQGSAQANKLSSIQQARLPSQKVVDYFRALALAMQPGNIPEFHSNMPQVARPIKDFERFALGKPSFTKNDMIAELIKKSDQLDSSLGKQLGDLKHKEVLIRTLSAQFNSSYKALAYNHDRARSPFGNLPAIHGAAAIARQLPYPEVSLELTPGAMDLLNKLRRPENRILLISNRSNRDLNLEVDQLNLRHYFDGILGDEQISTYGLNEEDRPIDEIKSRLPEKPDSAKLVELMENLNTRNVKRITLWGDRKSDLTQGNTLPEKYKGIERHGVLVNPSINLDKAAAQGMTSAYSLTQLHEHPQLQ